jgi:diadenosine tetraphosphate (Ap4A) HIT family hydrolase
MMVDPNVHFHVIPRYSTTRQWNDVEFPDTGWPGPPHLNSAVCLSAGQIAQLTEELSSIFR